MVDLSESTRLRLPRSERVEVQIMGPGFLDVVLARDISLGGVGVWVPHGFRGCDTSAPVELILTLPSRKPLRMRGTIKHRTAASEGAEFFGVEFIDLPVMHRKAIADYIARRVEEDPSLARPLQASRRSSR